MQQQQKWFAFTLNQMAGALFAGGVVLATVIIFWMQRESQTQKRIAALEKEVATLMARKSEQVAALPAVQPVSVAAPPAPVPEVQKPAARQQAADMIVRRFDALVKSDPPRALESLRTAVQKMDREGKPGEQWLIGEAIQMLERTAPDRADAELRGYFENKESTPYLRALAAGRLAKRGDDSPVRAYLDEAARGPLRSPNLAIRAEAVVNIANTESPAAVPYLIKMLNDPEFIVRARATLGLGLVGGEQAAAALVPLQDDQSPAVRDAAKRATEYMENVAYRRAQNGFK